MGCQMPCILWYPVPQKTDCSPCFCSHGSSRAAELILIVAFQVKSAWAGYYDYNYYDQNPIIGAHLAFDSFFQVCGFSGHGIQHAIAAGRGFMERFYDSAFKTIQLRKFGMERMLKQHRLESVGII